MEDFSVKDWLGKDNDLGISIWENKYRHNNESFGEWLDRVSAGDKEVKDLILSQKFLPGGRILANRGLANEGTKITYSNCFIAGTKVLTKQGYKSIEDIRPGELVLTHDNTWQLVNEVMSRDYEGDLYEIRGADLYEPIICTPNHKFLTDKNEWKAIENFRIKSDGHHTIDKLTTSSQFIPSQWINRIIDITEGLVLDSNNRLCIREDGMIGLENCYTTDNGTTVWRKPKKDNFINRVFTLDKDMLYLIGRWLGDGSVTNRKDKTNPSIWQLVFNATNEEDSCEKCKNILESHFSGININITKTQQNTLAIRIENEIFASWFKNNFGQYCDGKFVPDWIGNNTDVLLGLLDSDGSVHSQGDFKLLLKNSQLIDWARKTLFTAGINTSIIKTETRQSADSFTIHVGQTQKLAKVLNKTYSDNRMNKEGKDITHIKINEIIIHPNQKCLVYNLSIENNHSYMVNGVFAHNCYVISPPEDNIESIYETAKKLARTYSYGGGCGISISKLSPRNAKIRNAARTTSGAVSFMDTFSQVTEQIGQMGRRKLA